MKVRIYKSPDGNGKYLNKTGQFLEKAQKGKIVGKAIQLALDFDNVDKIQKATKLAKAIDKSNKLARAAGVIKYGEGIKKATTASSKIQIKNPTFFQNVLNTSNISPSTRKYHEKVIEAVIKNNNLATQSQYNVLQRIKNGTFPKYQLGGVPAESEMGYPGSASEKKEATQEELIELISNDLSNNIDEQSISYKLATFYDLDPMMAINLVSQVKDYIENQDVFDYDAYDEDEEELTADEEDVEEADLEEAKAVLEGPGQDLDEASNEIANSESIATQDDGFEDDMFSQYQYQSNQNDGYSYGGLYKAEDGAEASEELINPDGYVPNYPFDQTRHEITFPGIETYLPYNMSEFLDGTIDPTTGNYLNNLDETEEENVDEDEAEVENEENNVSENGDYYEGQTVDPSTDPSITQMKRGGNYKRNKRAYVNSILKLAKKAEGGEEKKSDNDPEAGDPTGAKIRKQKLNNFIGSLKKETEMFTLREQAEKQYDQMMQQQQQQIPPQNQMMQKGGSKEPRVVRGNELRYRANQLKDFITGQNRRDREDNIEYYNVNDYPTTTFEAGDYNKDGYTDAMDFASSPEQLKLRNNTPNQNQVSSSTVPKIGQTYDDWWVTSTGETPGFKPDNRKWNGKDWVSRAEYYGNSDYGNNVSYGNPSYTLDVRKSNWLTGRPSKYRIDFYGYSPLVDIANGNMSGTVSNKPIVNSSKVGNIVSTVNKSQSTDLQNDYFKTDANGDKIPDYLQPGPLSGLPINGAPNLGVPVVVANTPQEIAKTKELESNKTKQLITTKQAKEIAEAQKQVQFEKQILEAQRQVELQKQILEAQRQMQLEQQILEAKKQMQLEQQILEAKRQVQLEKQKLNGREQGGFVDSNNPDLYEFNYGGYDPTQQDMDYSNSIDTTDPYFQKGGRVRRFIENFVPGNVLSNPNTYYNEVQRIYDPRTGKTIPMPSNMGRVSSIKVDKSRFWSGKPKKYTVNFNGSSDYTVTSPNKNNSSSQKDNKQKDNQRSNVDGLSLKSRMAIRKGERQNERNSRRLKRQGLDEYGNRPGDEQGAIYNGDGKLVRDAEGNYYDRYNEKIPDKKRPSDMENWWQNDRYFKQNTKNNEPMSNEELFKSQGKTYDPILKKWLTADQRTTINMLNPESPTKDESGNLKEQLQSNGIYDYKQFKKDFNKQNLEPLIKESNENKVEQQLEKIPAVEEDEMLPFEQQYMESNEPIKNNFSNDGSPTEQQYIEDYETYFPEEIPQPAVNPFDFPESGGEETVVTESPVQPAPEPVKSSKSGKSLDQLRSERKKTLNSNKEYTYKFDISGAKDNKDYQQAIANAKKDGFVSEQEIANAFKIYDSYTAEAEKSKLASQAQRVRAQIDASNSSAEEKRVANNKVFVELQRRWAIIDNSVQQRFKTSYQDSTKFGSKQFGGNLDMFLPKKTVGGPPPCGVGEMLDPATNKCKAAPGSGVLKNNPPDGAPGSPGTIDSWGGTRAAMNPNIPFAANPGASMKQMMGLDTESMKSFNYPDGTPIGGNTNDPYSIDVKNKRTPLTFGKDNTGVSEARLNMFNAGVDIADSLRRGRESNKAENEMYENLSSNNLYASDPSRDRGDYDTNSGLFQPPNQGEKWNSRSAQYGGYIDEEEYYDPYVEEEEEELTYANGGEKITYMSEDQIRAFMAEGGQVEFL